MRYWDNQKDAKVGYQNDPTKKKPGHFRKTKDNINTTMERNKKAKKNNRCYSLLQMLRDFCGYTTCGGLGRVVGTKFIVFKKLPFPSAVFCNFNMIRKSEIKNLPDAAKQALKHYISGLTIEMDIEQQEYIDQLTQNAGAVVLISVRGKMPFPYEEGLSLAPGFATSMGLRLVHINRVDPFKNQSCMRNDSIPNENIYSKQYNVTYSKTACEQSCLAHSQREECKCMEYKFPVDKGSICDILNKTTGIPDNVFLFFLAFLQIPEHKTKQNFMENHLKGKGKESLGKINKNNLGYMFKKSLVKELHEERRNYSISGGTSNNLLKIHIFYEELNFEAIEESISYQIENFLSDVGGQLGLWLGVSVLSGVEVVELLALMLIYLFKNRSNIVTLDDPIAMEEGEWPYGKVLCDIQGFLIFTFAIASKTAMCAIAVNRFFAIVRPFHYTRLYTVGYIRKLIVFLWLLPSIISVPPLAGWGYYAFQPGKSICIYPFNVNIIYTLILEVFFVLTPQIITVVCYTRMRTSEEMNFRFKVDGG
ncbi:hypothetical protein QZH41_007800 [Actinostola sp. cb2023]|nr:hypothetical protein QZH41_007800 [Actinostola sp. cb2023]